MKRVDLIVMMSLLSVIFSFPSSVYAIDVPTIEALIASHKQMKKGEDACLQQVSEITAAQTATTSLTTKYNQVKTVLNKSIGSAYDYVILAFNISNVTLDLKKLIDEYAEFTEVSGETVARKPYMAMYFVKANKNIANEVSHLRKLILTSSVSTANLFKSSVKEKLEMVWMIGSSVTRMRGYIKSAALYIRLAHDTKIRLREIRDVLSDDFTKQLAKDLQTKWINKNKL